MTWIQTHWPLIVALAGAVYSLLSIINGAITNPEAKGIIGKILDGLSYIARGGAPGSVKMPFTLSKKPGLQPPTAGTIIAGQSARMLIPFLFAAFLLNGCGFGACLLGSIKAQYETVIEEAAIDLASANYVELLAQLGTDVGSDLVTCTVQAINNYEEAKQAKAAKAHGELSPSVVLQNARAWLGAHKAVVCAGRRAS